MIILTTIWGWISGASLKIWGYIAAGVVLVLAVLKIYEAGKTAEKASELTKNSEIKDDQLRAAVDRPNSNSDLDKRLRDPSRQF